MDITDDMLKTAVAKSVEAGLLPRRALKEDYADAMEMMRTILQSVLGKSALDSDSMADDMHICVDPSSVENPSDHPGIRRFMQG